MPTTSTNEHSPSFRWKLILKFFAAGSAIAAVVGFASSLSSFKTKFVVNFQEALVANEIDSIPIEFLNDSPYSIDWVRHSCELHVVLLKNGTKYEGLRSMPIVHKQERIDSGQGRTVFCFIGGEQGSKEVEAADLGFLITYKPWYSPFEQSKEFRFEVGPDPSGKLRAFRKNAANGSTFSF